MLQIRELLKTPILTSAKYKPSSIHNKADDKRLHLHYIGIPRIVFMKALS